MAGVRLPVRTHPLHAFVTNDFEQGLEKIVASTELACYVSQTERGQMLIGAEFDSQPSFTRVSSFDALRSYAYKITCLLPFLQAHADPADVGRPLRHLGRLQPDHGRHRRRRLPHHDRLGNVGLQGDPGRRRGPRGADRDRADARPHRAVRARPIPAATSRWPTRRRRGRADARARLPALRPATARRVRVRRRTTDGALADRGPRRARLRRGLDLRQPRRPHDRALVPRRRLPAVADGPPRHLDRHASSRSADAATSLVRDRTRFGPGAIDGLGDLVREAGGAASLRRHRRRRRSVGRDRPGRRRARGGRHRDRRSSTASSRTRGPSSVERASAALVAFGPAAVPSSSPVGGGSSMDAAKVVSLHAANGGDVLGLGYHREDIACRPAASSPCRRPPGPGPRRTPTA